MKEIDRIADQLQRAFYGEAWSGPSVMETVKGITADVAARKGTGDSHSIWELVHHVTAWLDIAKRRVQGQHVEVTPDINFPPVTETSEDAWARSLREMAHIEEELQELILQLPESQLDEPGVKDGHSVYVLLHGAIQHSLYHAGQIILLRK